MTSVILQTLGDEGAVSEVAGQSGSDPGEISVTEGGGGSGPQQGVGGQPSSPLELLLFSPSLITMTNK